MGDEKANPVQQPVDMARLLTLALLAGAVLAPAPATRAAFPPPGQTSKRQGGPHRHARRAAANQQVGSRNPVTTAAAVAERYWHAVPCAGHVKILADRPLASGLDPSTDGWVTFDSSLGADNLGAPAATYADCTISLAHWQWATWRDMEGDWGMFCLTVIHEMGHLLGYKHSLTRGSVMAPVFSSDANVPALCDTTWLPGWR